MSANLANNRIGRMLMHTLCVFKDRQWQWHWRGIVRELTLR